MPQALQGRDRRPAAFRFGAPVLLGWLLGGLATGLALFIASMAPAPLTTAADHPSPRLAIGRPGSLPARPAA